MVYTLYAYGKPRTSVTRHSQYVPTFGVTRAATKPLVRADGELVKSIGDLKRG